ncbi:hypothetical protein L8O22_22000 [Enterobacter roggenkampii]|uniref:hypothetical protein n=1 Tax=Enterobacter roggenkampii TaxID=1812935 RepID=UPI00200575A4|nr:hypothetical protein [Enterobacter roggenkampii]EKY4018176.1 hypothetical protein [Enterobacter roggenkampii]MCK7131592.1 hypothetical protein [Enterobacter roggenkampii]MCM7839057.1 hypothetical protein [Enterobacter roggenkampii]
MSNKYEDLIKNARMNADCGEHMSPEEVTTLLNVVETTFAALAAENARLKDLAMGWANATDDRLFEEHGEIFHDSIDACKEELKTICPATDAFLAEVRAAAVDEVCLKISNAIVNCYQDEQVGLDAAATICGEFAAQLRKGVQS